MVQRHVYANGESPHEVSGQIESLVEDLMHEHCEFRVSTQVKMPRAACIHQWGDK